MWLRDDCKKKVKSPILESGTPVLKQWRGDNNSTWNKSASGPKRHGIERDLNDLCFSESSLEPSAWRETAWWALPTLVNKCLRFNWLLYLPSLAQQLYDLLTSSLSLLRSWSETAGDGPSSYNSRTKISANTSRCFPTLILITISK